MNFLKIKLMLDLFVKSLYAQPVDIRETFPPAKNFFSLGSLINVVLPNALTFAGIIALIFTIIAGFIFISHAGQGKSEQAGKDKQAFTAAIIGLMIIFGAYLFLQIAGTLIGYDFLNPKL